MPKEYNKVEIETEDQDDGQVKVYLVFKQDDVVKKRSLEYIGTKEAADKVVPHLFAREQKRLQEDE